MASNSFGTIFRITTWGESHGKAIGVVIDGCPAGLPISEKEIQEALHLRAPGNLTHTSQRKEPDHAEILSGVFEGRTTGAPISILIPNKDASSKHYEPIKDLLRPGHANFTYLEKYGLFDYRGGGRASARETACRVAAGAIAKKLLHTQGIDILAYIKQIGPIFANVEEHMIENLRSKTVESPIFCPDPQATLEILQTLERMQPEGDSIGGLIEFMASGLPIGLGDPIYEKLEAKLSHALMSLPATKAIEIGSGLQALEMKGSEHNDLFQNHDGRIQTQTNHAGGVLGGISTGMPLVGKVAFKPTSSIMQSQNTVTTSGEEAFLQLPEGSRHDPCVAIRAVPVVEAMVALVLADALLLNRTSKL